MCCDWEDEGKTRKTREGKTRNGCGAPGFLSLVSFQADGSGYAQGRFEQARTERVQPDCESR